MDDIENEIHQAGASASEIAGKLRIREAEMSVHDASLAERLSVLITRLEDVSEELMVIASAWHGRESA